MISEENGSITIERQNPPYRAMTLKSLPGALRVVVIGDTAGSNGVSEVIVAENLYHKQEAKSLIDSILHDYFNL